MMISHEEVERLGLSTNSLKITDPKTGRVGYRAAIEVFHQLHCLNLLRQFTWKEHYSHTGGDIDAPVADIRGHVGVYFFFFLIIASCLSFFFCPYGGVANRG